MRLITFNLDGKMSRTAYMRKYMARYRTEHVERIRQLQRESRKRLKAKRV